MAFLALICFGDGCAEKTAHAAQRAAEKAAKAQRTTNRVNKARSATAESTPSESEATFAMEGEDNIEPVLGRLFGDDMTSLGEEALKKAREGMETVGLMLQNLPLQGQWIGMAWHALSNTRGTAILNS